MNVAPTNLIANRFARSNTPVFGVHAKNAAAFYDACGALLLLQLIEEHITKRCGSFFPLSCLSLPQR
jgi:hypothetical protein